MKGELKSALTRCGGVCAIQRMGITDPGTTGTPSMQRSSVVNLDT